MAVVVGDEIVVCCFSSHEFNVLILSVHAVIRCRLIVPTSPFHAASAAVVASHPTVLGWLFVIAVQNGALFVAALHFQMGGSALRAR